MQCSSKACDCPQKQNLISTRKSKCQFKCKISKLNFQNQIEIQKQLKSRIQRCCSKTKFESAKKKAEGSAKAQFHLCNKMHSSQTNHRKTKVEQKMQRVQPECKPEKLLHFNSKDNNTRTQRASRKCSQKNLKSQIQFTSKSKCVVGKPSLSALPGDTAGRPERECKARKTRLKAKMFQ